MPTHGTQTREDIRPNTPAHHRSFLPSGLALRILIALILSWLIVMVFFATNAASH